MRCLLGSLGFASLLGLSVACVGDAPTGYEIDTPDPSRQTSDTLPDGGAAAPDSATQTSGSNEPASGPRCDLGQPFGAPEAFNVDLSGAGDDLSPRLTNDEKTLYFSTTRGGRAHYRVVKAVKNAATGRFEGVADVLPAQSAFHEMNPSLTSDLHGLLLSQTSAADAFASRILFLAPSDGAGGFLTPVPLNGAYTADDGDAYMLPDGHAFYFAGPQGTYRTIYRWKQVTDAQGTRYMSDDAVFSGNEHFVAPVFSADENTVFMGVGAEGDTSLNSVDIQLATRPSFGAAWSTPAPVSVLNSSAYDAPAWISPDGCVLTFTSQREGMYRMYRAQRGK